MKARNHRQIKKSMILREENKKVKDSDDRYYCYGVLFIIKYLSISMHYVDKCIGLL